MKLRTALALSASVLALAMQPARAEPPGWYVGAGGGWTHLNDFNTTATSGVPFDFSFDEGFGAIGFAGYNFGYFRAEGEIGYRRNAVNNVNIIGFNFPTSGDANTLSLMANGIYDFFPNSQWTPYLGAGVGIARVNANNFNSGGVLINSINTQFAYQGIAGVSYSIAPQLSLAVDYRYFSTLDPAFSVESDAGGGTFSPGYHTHNVFLTLTYHFGVAPPAPIPVVAPAPPPPAPPPAPSARISLVFFDFNKSTLTPDGRKVVEQAASVYKSGGVGRIDLTGYTDLSGTQQYNLGLSQARADAVSTYLVQLGVPATAISEKARGKENPRVPTPDGVREPQNRRVEIIIP
jgi:OmpA-OmpF porin, OOP family